MNLRLILLISVGMAALISPARAQLIDVTFTEDVSGGTITGDIEGLSLGTTSTPTDIIITSQPTGSPSYPQAPTLDLIASGYGFLGGDNTFTVSSTGTITGSVGIYKIISTGPDTGDYQGYAFNLTTGLPGLDGANGIYLTTGSGSIITSNANTNGLAGIQFAIVPEPHRTTAIFLLAGVVLLVGRKLCSRVRGNN